MMMWVMVGRDVGEVGDRLQCAISEAGQGA